MRGTMLVPPHKPTCGASWDLPHCKSIRDTLLGQLEDWGGKQQQQQQSSRRSPPNPPRSQLQSQAPL